LGPVPNQGKLGYLGKYGESPRVYSRGITPRGFLKNRFGEISLEQNISRGIIFSKTLGAEIFFYGGEKRLFTAVNIKKILLM